MKKKLLSLLLIMLSALLLSACGKDPIAELENQITKEEHQERRDVLSELAQIFRQERAGATIDATRGLALSVRLNNQEFVQFFIRKGADVNGECTSYDSYDPYTFEESSVCLTMLGFASENGHYEIGKILVDAGANVNSSCKKNHKKNVREDQKSTTKHECEETAILLAMKSFSEDKNARDEFVHFLFEKGASLECRECDGESPALLLATEQGDLKMVEWLIKNGAKPKRYSHLGRKPTSVYWGLKHFFAVSPEDTRLLKLLIENGANIRDMGRILDLLICSSYDKEKSFKEKVEFLEKSGIKLEIPKIEVVKIPGRKYAFGKYEITRAQYDAVMPSEENLHDNEPVRVAAQHATEEDSDAKKNYPKTLVSYREAEEFCDRMTYWGQALKMIAHNQRYRLPSREEWLHACCVGKEKRKKIRLGHGFELDGTEWVKPSFEEVKRTSWYSEDYNGNFSYPGRLYPVGQKEPNAFGIYDMLGNVSELTSDKRECGGDCWSNSLTLSKNGEIEDDERDLHQGFRVVLDPATPEE